MKRIVRIAPLVILALAVLLLARELRHIRWVELERTLLNYPWSAYVFAAFLLALNYVIWSGYDWTSLDQLGLRLPYGEIFRTTSVAFPISNLLGYSLITGFATRARRYEPFGVTYMQVTKVILYNVTTWWIGFLFLCGLAIVYSPDGEMFRMPEQVVTFIGCGLLALVVFYLLIAWRARGEELKWRQFVIHFPSLRSGFTKILVSSADNLVVGLTLFLFLPGAHEVSFARFMAYFLSAYLIALLSFIPAGWGVLEGVLLYLFRPYSSDTEILASMVLFRIYHYLLPVAAGFMAILARKSYTLWIASRPAV